MVIDSIDDLEKFDYKQLLPQCKHRNLIITTTQSQRTKSLDFLKIEVGSIGLEAGAEMLLSNINPDDIGRQRFQICPTTVNNVFIRYCEENCTRARWHSLSYRTSQGFTPRMSYNVRIPRLLCKRIQSRYGRKAREELLVL